MKLFFVFACFLLSTPGQAQEIFSTPPAKFLTKFYFEPMTGGVMLIRATLDDGSDSLNFILDTGSGGISLDSNTAAELNLTITPSDRTIRGIAGVRTVEYAKHHTLRLPGLVTDSLDFHINDYGLLTAVYGVRIDGIIGFSLLRRYIVDVNYDHNELSFYSPGYFQYTRGGTLLRPSFNSLPIQAAIVKDNVAARQRFYFDTGGGLCLLLSEDFVRDSALFLGRKKLMPTMAEGMGGKKKMMITTVKELKLGPYKFKKVPTYIFEDEFNVTSYPSLGGLLGADLLRRFNITLNYPRAEIYLLPNTHFREAFDYSYTGMEIYYEEGKVIIGEIIKNSPAEASGLQVGDEIFSVDNVVGTSFQGIRNSLQSAGNRLKIIVLRNKQPFEIKMKVGRID
ncbi:MAG: aspartyl protease family protein [Chitinophagaceae bacterium]